MRVFCVESRDFIVKIFFCYVISELYKQLRTYIHIPYIIIRFVKGFIIEMDYTKCGLFFFFIFFFLYLSLLQFHFKYLSLTYKCLKLYAYTDARIQLFYKC